MTGWFEAAARHVAGLGDLGAAAIHHAFGSNGCQLTAIREVDWYRRTTREFDYALVTYWQVGPDGMRTHQERSEELPPDREGPSYTYLCTACEQRFWFWSDVLLHVGNA